MKYLEELKNLNLPKNKFAIFGSGPLAIRNLRDNKDLDLIVKKDLWNKLIKKYKISDRGSVNIGSIEIWKDWGPLFKNINKLIDDSDIIKGIRFVKLKYVLKWKKKRNKEKDKKDVILIENYLK